MERCRIGVSRTCAAAPGSRSDEAKDDPLDFVLWKSSKPGEPSWESPWGPGRPGWHIECSAMSTQCLGNHFDIHGGGMDLQFPHHENEIAQSEAATGSRFVNVWMHNGFVRIDDEKMSKSLGNFFTVRGVLAHYPAEAVRWFMLSSHYRSPLNYSEDHLRQADASVRRLYTALRGLDASEGGPDGGWLARFRAAMDDDLNTPEAMSVLFDIGHRDQPYAPVGPGSGARACRNAARARRDARASRRRPGRVAARRGRRRGPGRRRDRGHHREARGRAGRAGTGPRRIVCAMRWQPPESCSRTARRGRSGGVSARKLCNAVIPRESVPWSGNLSQTSTDAPGCVVS